MTLLQILDASGLVVLTAQGGWILLLYRRMGRLRSALESAGDVVGSLDEASRRLDASAGGIVGRVRDGIAEIDSKILSCRKLSQDLSVSARNAEEVATRLDQALRLNRRLQQARAAAPPRELVAPLGLAERLSAAPAEALPAPEVEFLPAMPQPLSGLGFGPLSPAPSAVLPAALCAGAQEEQRTEFGPPLPLELRLDLPPELPRDLADLLPDTGKAGLPPEPAPAPAPAGRPFRLARAASARSGLPRILQPRPTPLAQTTPPPPLEEVLAAELLFAGLGEPPLPRTIRVKLG
jgi:hypothetical protein